MEAGFLSICVKEGYCGDGVGGWSGEGMKVKWSHYGANFENGLSEKIGDREVLCECMGGTQGVHEHFRDNYCLKVVLL